MAIGRIPEPGTGIPESIIAAKGDILTGTANDTPAVLSVGTNGHTLVADSGESTGLKWVAASSGALTLIQRSTFSNVANTGTTFDGVFTSTYKVYQVVIEKLFAATAGDDAVIELLASGVVLSTNYNGAAGGGVYNSATFSNIQNNNTTKFTFETDIGDTTNSTGAVLYFQKVGNASERAQFFGTSYSAQSGIARVVGQSLGGAADTYTGFRLLSSSSNVSGTVSIYGLATA
jgi:hypothetical protein